MMRTSLISFCNDLSQRNNLLFVQQKLVPINKDEKKEEEKTV